MRTEKLLNLESLRGIAAIAVAFYHFNTGGLFNNIFVLHAWIMVDFFFVLSGFVIALNYSDRLTTPNQLYTFQKKRFLRLYPLHILMLLVFVGLESSKYFATVYLNLESNNPAFQNSNLLAFIANVFLVQNWVLPNLSFNYPSWSISAEFFTYAIFAGLVFLTGKSKKLFYAISLLLIVVAWVGLQTYGMGTPFNLSGPFRCIFGFFIGVFLHLVYSGLKEKITLTSSVPAIIALTISIALIIAYGGEKGGMAINLPIVFGLLILVLVLTSRTALVNVVLNNRYLVYFGTISYGIYMIHAAVWWVMYMGFRFAFSIPSTRDDQGQAMLLFDNVLIATAVSFIGMVIIIFLAHLSYRHLETRFTRPSKKKQSETKLQPSVAET